MDNHLSHLYQPSLSFLSNGRESHHIKDGHVISVLVRWASRMPPESLELALSVLLTIDNLLKQSRHSLTECCDGDCISAIVACITHLCQEHAATTANAAAASAVASSSVSELDEEEESQTEAPVRLRRTLSAPPQSSGGNGPPESPLVARLFELLVRLGGHSLAPGDLRALLRLFQTPSTLVFGKRLLQVLFYCYSVFKGGLQIN